MAVATQALRHGLGEATRRLRITLCLYAANLAAAVALAAPMAWLLERSLGQSAAASGLESRFRLGVLLDFLRANRPALEVNFQALGIGAMAYALLSAILSGGVIDTLRGAPRSPFLPRFFGGCGRLAFRFMRLLPYLALVLLGLHWLGRGLDRLILAAFEQTPHEVAAFWALRGKQAVMILLVLLTAAIFDLARVLTALEDRAHMSGALLTSAGFVARHPASVLALYGMLAGLGLALFVPYLLLAQHLLPAASIVALVALQQAVMLLRHWFRVVGYGALVSLYRHATGAPAAGPGPSVGPAAAATLAAVALPWLGLILSGAADAVAAPPDRPAAPAPAAAQARTSGPDRPGGGTADYRIEARLDPVEHRVSGRETITYRNRTGAPMPDLRFHLYPNAFSNNRTLFMRGAAPDDDEFRAAVDRMARDGTWGLMDIQAIALAGGPDLTAAARIEETVMTVPLPAPVRPGQEVRVEVAWETRLPRTLDRMGYWGRHHDIMQWFPKLGVFTADGWNVHPFHHHSEFFADFGTYSVTLTTPEGYAVEATGVPGEAGRNPDGTRSVTYRAEDVHDFAWIADPNAKSARRVVEAGPYAGRPVEIVYFHQPHRARMAPRILRAAEEGLLYYGRRFLPYPYPRVVIDDLPMGLGGGMEYPMLFTVSRAHWFVPAAAQGIESLTLHEFGHQYWYGILASNEFEEPWLDEGVNSFVTRRAMEAIYGAGRPGRTVNALFTWGAARILDEGLEAHLGGFALDLDRLFGFGPTPFLPRGGGLLGSDLDRFDLDLPGLRDGLLEGARESYARVAGTDPLSDTSWGFRPGSYSPLVYSKTDLALETVARIMGGDAMDRALREYVEAFRFAHPRGADFLAILEKAVRGARPEVDPGPLLDTLFRSDSTIDFAIAAFDSREIAPPRGFLPPARAGQPPEDRRAPPPPSSAGPDRRYETELIVEQRGTAALPVDVSVRFESGQEIRALWDGRGAWTRFTFETGSRAEEASVDPEGVHVLDLDRNNNGRTLERQTRAVARLALVWLFWLQNYLHLWACLA